MNYELYTLPNCQECTEIKNFLDDKKINYEEVNAGTGEGRKRFKELFRNHREQIKRENQGIVLPVLIRRSDSKIEGITQGEKILNHQFS